jgi:hypothetical protein
MAIKKKTPARSAPKAAVKKTVAKPAPRVTTVKSPAQGAAAKAAAKASIAPKGSSADSLLNPSKNSKIVFDKRGSLASCKGTASYAFLKKADSYQGGDPTHKITVTFDESDPDYARMVDQILAFENEYLRSIKKSETKVPACIRRDKVTNAPCITFKVGAKDDGNGGHVPIPVVDAAKEPVTGTYVANGDTVIVAFSLGGISTNVFSGAKPYLNAVQLLDACGERKGGGSTNAFEVQTDFLSEVEGELQDEGESGEDVLA